MKKIIVSSAKRKNVPKVFQPEWLANRLMVESEFKDGKLAYVKYANGKLTIHVGKKLREVE